MADGNSALKFLQAATFLGALPDDALNAIVKFGHIKHYRKGQTIFDNGDPGDYMLIILSGRIKISNIGAEAREIILNLLSAGDLIGEIAVLSGGERTAAAVALEDTQTFQLFRRDLMPVLMAHPEALVEIVAILCDKLRNTSAIIEDTHSSMQGRLAAALWRLAQQHGHQTKDGILIGFELNQRDLGNYASLSRENISRQLASLSKAGIILVSNGKVLIKDASRLMALADGIGTLD